MDDHGEFDSVSWQREDASRAETSAPFPAALPERPAGARRSESMSSEPQAGEDADQVDLAGIGRDGSLEVTVDTPLKENDGTKDAYVSYLVTTNVSILALHENMQLTEFVDRLQVLPERRIQRPTTFHRLCLPTTSPTSRLPSLRYPAAP